MAPKKSNHLVLTYLVVALPFALTTCPSREDVAPCTCEDSWGRTTIKCSKLDNEDLAKVTSSLRGMTFDSFTIQNSKFGYIPHDTFKGVKFAQLLIIRSTLKALTDKGDAFVGLEDHLDTLYISHCVFQNEWVWSVLRNLKKLKSLDINSSNQMRIIGEDIKKISVSSLEKFFFTRNNISFVSSHAFDSFENIKYLSLAVNNIKNVKRTMLPNPAVKLNGINLGDNQIQQFPKDMFTSMPNLRDLYIQYNKILVLNERTFSPVWEQLDRFFAAGNPLRCECGMSWIPEERTPRLFSGTCASPPELKGKELIKLTSKDFVCYV